MEFFITILGALIGGSCTIGAAFITRGYVVKRTQNPSYRLGGIVKSFIEFFSVFKVSNAIYLELPNETVYTDETLNITFIQNYGLVIVLKDKSEKYVGYELGKREYVQVNGREYRIMIIRENNRDPMAIEIRAMV